MYILFSEGYIQRYSPDTEVIFRPRQKKSRGQGRARGPKARGHGPARGIFFCRGRKISEVEAGISLYIARRK